MRKLLFAAFALLLFVGAAHAQSPGSQGPVMFSFNCANSPQFGNSPVCYDTTAQAWYGWNTTTKSFSQNPGGPVQTHQVTTSSNAQALAASCDQGSPITEWDYVFNATYTAPTITLGANCKQGNHLIVVLMQDTTGGITPNIAAAPGYSIQWQQNGGVQPFIDTNATNRDFWEFDATTYPAGTTGLTNGTNLVFTHWVPTIASGAAGIGTCTPQGTVATSLGTNAPLCTSLPINARFNYIGSVTNAAIRTYVCPTQISIPSLARWVNVWTASTVIPNGGYVIDSNGNVEQAPSGAGGTTGGSAPSWCTTLKCTTMDNGINWSLQQFGSAGASGSTPSYGSQIGCGTAPNAADIYTLTNVNESTTPLGISLSTACTTGGPSGFRGSCNQPALDGTPFQSVTGSAVNTANGTIPADANVGDGALLLCSTGTGGLSFTSWTTPAGWAIPTVSGYQVSNTPAASLFEKTITSADLGATVTCAYTGTAAKIGIGIYTFKNTPAGEIIDQVHVQHNASGTTNACADTTGVNPTGTDDLQASICTSPGSVHFTWTAPADMTGTVSGSSSGQGIAFRNPFSAINTGTNTATISGNQTSDNFTVTLLPAVGTCVLCQPGELLKMTAPTAQSEADIDINVAGQAP